MSFRTGIYRIGNYINRAFNPFSIYPGSGRLKAEITERLKEIVPTEMSGNARVRLKYPLAKKRFLSEALIKSTVDVITTIEGEPDPISFSISGHWTMPTFTKLGTKAYGVNLSNGKWEKAKASFSLGGYSPSDIARNGYKTAAGALAYMFLLSSLIVLPHSLGFFDLSSYHLSQDLLLPFVAIKLSQFTFRAFTALSHDGAVH